MKNGMPERRSIERFRTKLIGWVAYDENAPAVECILWDLSTTGARLVFPDPALIPLDFDQLEFDLHILEEGMSARVRLIWTTGEQYGVRFTN